MANYNENSREIAAGNDAAEGQERLSWGRGQVALPEGYHAARRDPVEVIERGDFAVFVNRVESAKGDSGDDSVVEDQWDDVDSDDDPNNNNNRVKGVFDHEYLDRDVECRTDFRGIEPGLEWRADEQYKSLLYWNMPIRILTTQIANGTARILALVLLAAWHAVPHPNQLFSFTTERYSDFAKVTKKRVVNEIQVTPEDGEEHLCVSRYRLDWADGNRVSNNRCWDWHFEISTYLILNKKKGWRWYLQLNISDDRRYVRTIESVQQDFTRYFADEWQQQLANLTKKATGAKLMIYSYFDEGDMEIEMVDHIDRRRFTQGRPLNPYGTLMAVMIAFWLKWDLHKIYYDIISDRHNYNVVKDVFHMYAKHQDNLRLEVDERRFRQKWEVCITRKDKKAEAYNRSLLKMNYDLLDYLEYDEHWEDLRDAMRGEERRKDLLSYKMGQMQLEMNNQLLYEQRRDPMWMKRHLFKKPKLCVQFAENEADAAEWDRTREFEKREKIIKTQLDEIEKSRLEAEEREFMNILLGEPVEAADAVANDIAEYAVAELIKCHPKLEEQIREFSVEQEKSRLTARWELIRLMIIWAIALMLIGSSALVNGQSINTTSDGEPRHPFDIPLYEGGPTMRECSFDEYKFCPTSSLMLAAIECDCSCGLYSCNVTWFAFSMWTRGANVICSYDSITDIDVLYEQCVSLKRSFMLVVALVGVFACFLMMYAGTKILTFILKWGELILFGTMSYAVTMARNYGDEISEREYYAIVMSTYYLRVWVEYIFKIVFSVAYFTLINYVEFLPPYTDKKSKSRELSKFMRMSYEEWTIRIISVFAAWYVFLYVLEKYFRAADINVENFLSSRYRLAKSSNVVLKSIDNKEAVITDSKPTLTAMKRSGQIALYINVNGQLILLGGIGAYQFKTEKDVVVKGLYILNHVLNYASEEVEIIMATVHNGVIKHRKMEFESVVELRENSWYVAVDGQAHDLTLIKSENIPKFWSLITCQMGVIPDSVCFSRDFEDSMATIRFFEENDGWKCYENIGRVVGGMDRNMLIKHYINTPNGGGFSGKALYSTNDRIFAVHMGYFNADDEKYNYAVALMPFINLIYLEQYDTSVIDQFEANKDGVEYKWVKGKLVRVSKVNLNDNVPDTMITDSQKYYKDDSEIKEYTKPEDMHLNYSKKMQSEVQKAQITDNATIRIYGKDKVITANVTDSDTTKKYVATEEEDGSLNQKGKSHDSVQKHEQYEKAVSGKNFAQLVARKEVWDDYMKTPVMPDFAPDVAWLLSHQKEAGLEEGLNNVEDIGNYYVTRPALWMNILNKWNKSEWQKKLDKNPGGKHPYVPFRLTNWNDYTNDIRKANAKQTRQINYVNHLKQRAAQIKLEAFVMHKKKFEYEYDTYDKPQLWSGRVNVVKKIINEILSDKNLKTGDVWEIAAASKAVGVCVGKFNDRYLLSKKCMSDENQTEYNEFTKLNEEVSKMLDFNKTEGWTKFKERVDEMRQQTLVDYLAGNITFVEANDKTKGVAPNIPKMPPTGLVKPPVTTEEANGVAKNAQHKNFIDYDDMKKLSEYISNMMKRYVDKPRELQEAIQALYYAHGKSKTIHKKEFQQELQKLLNDSPKCGICGNEKHKGGEAECRTKCTHKRCKDSPIHHWQNCTRICDRPWCNGEPSHPYVKCEKKKQQANEGSSGKPIAQSTNKQDGVKSQACGHQKLEKEVKIGNSTIRVLYCTTCDATHIPKKKIQKSKESSNVEKKLN